MQVKQWYNVLRSQLFVLIMTHCSILKTFNKTYLTNGYNKTQKNFTTNWATLE